MRLPLGHDEHEFRLDAGNQTKISITMQKRHARMARSPWDGAGLHPVDQCPESRAHLGRRQVDTMTMPGKDPLELVLSKPPK